MPRDLGQQMGLRSGCPGRSRGCPLLGAALIFKVHGCLGFKDEAWLVGFLSFGFFG